MWAHSAANKFGRRLAQGVGTRIKGTNTINFIQKDQVPNDRAGDVTYGSFSCDYKQNKEEKKRTRLTAGGDQINYLSRHQNTDRRYDTIQKNSEQCYLNQRSKMHDDRLERFLSEHTD